MPSLASSAHLSYPSVRRGAAAPPRAMPAGRRVSKLALWLFFIMLTFNTLNLGTLYTYAHEGKSPIPINPITFAVLAVMIMPLTSSPHLRMTYFRAAWFFWIAFTVGGFLGPDQISFGSMTEMYRLAQTVLKIWISIIGVPYLAYRTIDERNLVKFGKVIYVLVAAGAIFSIVQLLYPQALPEISTKGGGRGAGLWIDPNMGATMGACGILLSLMFPFRWLVLNVAVRIVLVCGLGATLSRGGILTCLIALMVYGITLGRWTAVLKTVVVTVLLGVIGLAALEPLKQSSIEGLAARAEGIQQMLMGGVRGQTLQGRWYLWSQGAHFAAKNWFRGRGHGSMNFAVKLKYLENEGRWHSAGPHNYYIFVWGNSGVLGITAFLAFLGCLLWIAMRSKVRRIRAGLLGLLTVFAVFACSDHSMFAFQFFGAIFAIYALAGHYSRRRPMPARSGKPRARAVDLQVRRPAQFPAYSS